MSPAEATLPDQSAISLQQGDHDALSSLMSRYRALFASIAYRYVDDHSVVDDLLQEAFIKIYSNIHQYDFRGNFEGWMKRILVNTCLNWVRQSKRVDKVSLDSIEFQIGEWMSTDTYSDLGTQDIKRHIDRLPEGYKKVLTMYTIEGYDHNEIADHLGISPSSSRSQLTKARSKLKSMLVEG